MTERRRDWIRVAVLGLAVLCAGQASAQSREPAEDPRKTRWAIGPALLLKAEPYRDLDDDVEVFPIPFLSVETGRLRINGPQASFGLVSGGRWSLAAVGNPRFGVDSDDSDYLEGLDDRDATFEAGLQVGYKARFIQTGFRAVFDTLGVYGGYELQASVATMLPAGKWLFRPEIGIVYQSDDLVDYYYGVDTDEATMIRPAFEGDASVNLAVGMLVVRPLPKRWSFVTILGVDVLGSDITDSPIVSKDYSAVIITGFQKSFGKLSRADRE